MAPAKADDENLKFLFTCFQSAVKNGGKVDMKVVAAVHQINTGAASMRLTRIKKALGTSTEQNELDDEGGNSATGGAPPSPKTPKIKTELDEKDGNTAVRKTPKSLKTPKTKAVAPISTPTPTQADKGKGKSKKRKLNEEEQVDELIQRAGIEALTHGNMDLQVEIDQLRDVMLQTNDEDLKLECGRQILVKEENLA